MQKLLLATFFSVLLFSHVHTAGQVSITDQQTQTTSNYKKGIYLSLLGPNLLIGFNYDMRLNKGVTNGVGFRVGIGGGSIPYDGYRHTFITLPIGINCLFGSRSNFLLIEGGFLPSFYKFSGFGTREGVLGIRGGYAAIGYRYQSPKNGFLGQITWNPLINKGGRFQALWMEIGLGASL